MYERSSDGTPALTVEPAEDIAALRGEWTALAEAGGNLFATWEWADCWLRHYGEGRQALPFACRDATGAVVAILPLCLDRRGPLRIARFVGFGPADEQGPVCASEHVAAAIAALPAARKASPERWSVLLAERLPAGRDWAAELGGRELNRESSPVVDVEGLDWDGYLAGRSSNFRSQIRRKERKLQREHGLTYRLSEDPRRLDGDLDTLFALHEARWGDEGSGAFDDTRQAFHRDFAHVALERGWLRLWIAEVEGNPIAAWHGFRFGGSEWYYQFGRDPQWDSSSIGLVLLAHSLRAAIEDGVPRYRLLRGGEAYKARFSTGDPGVVTVAAPRGALGRAVVAGARAALGMPGPARRVATRMAG